MLAGASADDIIPREAGGNSYACFYRELDECIGRGVVSESLFKKLWVVLQKNSEKKGIPALRWRQRMKLSVRIRSQIFHK